MSDCIAPECWNTLELSRLRCWNIGGGFFLLYSEKKVTLGKNGKLLLRGGKSYILSKCYRECYRECYRKKTSNTNGFSAWGNKVTFFSL